MTPNCLSPEVARYRREVLDAPLIVRPHVAELDFELAGEVDAIAERLQLGAAQNAAAVETLQVAARLVRRSPAHHVARDGEVMVCEGCGTTRSLQAIKVAAPKTFSCCPERKMLPARHFWRLALELQRERGPTAFGLRVVANDAVPAGTIALAVDGRALDRRALVEAAGAPDRYLDPLEVASNLERELRVRLWNDARRRGLSQEAAIAEVADVVAKAKLGK